LNSWIDLSALWKIVVVGLIAGAGLPAVFAVGLRALTLGGPPPASATGPDGDRLVGSNPVGIAAAALCFAIVLAGVGWGIYFIVSAS
jgi:hypothetical protein